MEENTTETAQKPNLPEPNPVTRAAHRRDYRRGVLFPLIGFIVLLVGLGVAFVLLPVGDVTTWSQIATILLVLLALLLGLITLVILGGLVYLVSYILGILPGYTRMAQDGIETIKKQAIKGADITAKPVIQVQSFLAVVNAIFGRKQS
ncbi:MAG: hypothetical protein P8046_00850 [Anaerolineales bacterium]